MGGGLEPPPEGYDGFAAVHQPVSRRIQSAHIVAQLGRIHNKNFN